jgi:hypothetical protein
MKASRLFWAGLALLGAELVPSHALAQARARDAPTAERASARALADQGFDAFDAAQWQVALDRFERAESLVHSPVQSLFLARCQANLGLLLEAKETYLAITRERLAGDASAAMADAQRAAAAELAELEARIPFVLVAVDQAGDAAELVVTMDGQRVPPALIGVPYPLNPGHHAWQAEAGASKSVLEPRVVREGSRETVSLRLVAAPAPLSEVARSSPPPAPAPIVARASALPWGVVVGLGVGAVGAGVGAGFALKKASLDGEIERTCRADACPGTAHNLELEGDANRAGMVATIAFIGAGAAVASAVGFWILGSETRSETVAAVRPWLGVGSAGASGRF